MPILYLSAMRRPPPEPSFVSRRVTAADRYYIDLSPPRSAKSVVVCGGCERVRADYRVERSTFPFFAVEFVAEGAGTLDLNGREWALQPGVAFAYGPGVAHRIEARPELPMRKYYVDFAGREAAKMLEGSPLGRWVPVRIAQPQEIAEIFEMLQREGAEPSPAGPALCHALLPVLLMKIEQRARPMGGEEPRAFSAYEKARRWIEGHFIEARTAEEIARACHMTPAYLSRLFRRFARSGAYQFLIRLKMNHAMRLLMDDGFLVKEAAAALGFADAFHFSRVFKRVHGVPPERFTCSGANCPLRQPREDA
jgi:AraC-like DNA-binding protein